MKQAIETKKTKKETKRNIQDETTYIQAMDEAMNVLKTTKRTLWDKEIF